MNQSQLRRREVLRYLSALSTWGLGCTGAMRATSCLGDDAVRPHDPNLITAIATWSFGVAPCDIAISELKSGRHRLDGVEAAIRHAEADAENRSVGIGGIPNADGVVQLDASIMDGEKQRAGAVAALEGFAHPITVARLVMERTPHVMLVGEGANAFAREMNCETAELLVPREQAAYQEWLKSQRKQIDPVSADNHDTIALLVRDAAGGLAGGCSTSGWGYKRAGRVGDSPIIAGGLYVDGDVGAAGATGLGELTMRYAGSFLVVETMRRGASPEEACSEAVLRIVKGEQRPASELSINFIAIDKQGRVGAAGTDAEFCYAIATSQQAAEVRLPRRIE